MAERELDINYSIEDIERYLNGSMNAKDMHEMERAALNDPFLADAIEGYSETNFQTAYTHLNEIHAAVYTKQEGAKVIPIGPKKTNWLSVAAVAVLIIITGTASWYIIGLNKSEDIQSVPAIAETKEAQSTATDSLTSTADTTITLAQLNKSGKQKLPSKKQLAAIDNHRDKEASTELPVATLDNQSAASVTDDKKNITPSVTSNAPVTSGTSANNNAAVKKGYYTFANKQPVLLYNGRVTDNNNRPVANAILIAPGDIRAFTNEQGYFILRSPDSILNVVVSSIGFAEEEAKLNSSVSNNIVINPENSSLSEVVVTGFGKKKMVAKNTDSTAAHPAVGWESFQEYVYKQVNQEMDTTLSDVTSPGNVQLEFSVDNDGDPIDFKVVKSLDPLYDNKAIDIVKKGPKWVAGKRTKKAKVTIQF